MTGAATPGPFALRGVAALRSRRPLRRSTPVRSVLSLLVALPFVLPFAWLVLSALKPRDQFLMSPPTLLPSPFTLEAVFDVLRVLETPRLLANSTLIAILSVIFSVGSSALVGFGFATLRARGSRVLFALLVGTILIPPAALMVPQFILFSRLGWVGSYLPLIVPHLFGSAFFIFLFRQWFMSLPAHVFESAELEGASPWQSFRYIAVPLAKPVIAVAVVFAFVGSWNDFLAPLIYLRSPDSFTVSVGMATLDGIYIHDPQRSVAMALIALIPPVVVFLGAQRFLAGTLMAGTAR